MTGGNSKLRRTLPLVIVVDLILLAAAGWWIYSRCFALPRRFAVVEAGVLYRSGQGSKAEIENALERYGIKTIICVREHQGGDDPKWLTDDREAAAEFGAEVEFWTTPSGQPLDEDLQLAFLRLTEDPARRPVWVHCGQGRHRTGFVVAIYRMVRNGWSLEKTLKEMESFGFDLNTHTKLVDAVKGLNPDVIRARLNRPATQPLDKGNAK